MHNSKSLACALHFCLIPCNLNERWEEVFPRRAYKRVPEHCHRAPPTLACLPCSSQSLPNHLHKVSYWGKHSLRDGLKVGIEWEALGYRVWTSREEWQWLPYYPILKGQLDVFRRAIVSRVCNSKKKKRNHVRILVSSGAV